jgi:non-homologous end joining protein Ku
MSMIEKRLDKYDTGEFTQKMEQDVIDALKEMIEALKKKQQEMKDSKNKPPPPGGQPPPQRLLDLLAELKLIRSQQVAVNKRTIDYGSHYQGEQTNDPLLQKELETLSKRQAKLEDMLKKIATGKNQ